MAKLLVSRRGFLGAPSLQRHVYDFPTKCMPDYFDPIHYKLKKKGIRVTLEYGEKLKYTYILFHTQYFGEFIECDAVNFQHKISETTYMFLK